MKQVMEASAKRWNQEVDEKAVKAQEEAIIKHFYTKSDAFYTSGRVLDQGIIDPRDTRKIIGIVLDTCLEAKRRKLKPNSFGIGRM